MKTIRVPAVVILLVFTVAPVFAQVSGALLSGTVTDPSGAAVSRAQVVIRNVSTDIERTAVSDSNGLYSAPNLTPGVYNRCKRPGISICRNRYGYGRHDAHRWWQQFGMNQVLGYMEEKCRQAQFA